MLPDAQKIQSLSELRDFVYLQLCELNELEPGVFEMVERILARGEKPCGILFCLYGPRSVRLTAIWETDGNSILFYDSAGERADMVKLRGAPRLAQTAA